MTTYRLDDDTIVDTDNATAVWQEDTEWDGSNHISRATGSQWEHQTLYRSRRGRYYLVHSSQWQGSTPTAELLSDANAARWLVLMGHPLPEDLSQFEMEVVE